MQSLESIVRPLQKAHALLRDNAKLDVRWEAVLHSASFPLCEFYTLKRFKEALV